MEYTTSTIDALAERSPPTHPVPGPGGVAVYGGPQEGQIVDVNAARKFAAQLLTAADEHDAIAEAAQPQQQVAQPVAALDESALDPAPQ